MKKPKKLMNLGVGLDLQMAQLQSSFLLSYHDTKSPDHGAFTKGAVILPLDRPDLWPKALSL